MNHDEAFQGLRRERMLASAQYADGVFRNESEVKVAGASEIFPLLGEYFFGEAERFPKKPLPLERPHDIWRRAPDTAYRMTWLGHSTVLLELDGRTILTDPVFGERASPISFMGPRRFHETPSKLKELPPLDLIVLSHDHYDHLCRATMLEIAKLSVPIVTPLGVGARLEAFGIDRSRITELDWHEQASFPGLRVTATPSQHFSGRSATDRNATLWASFVIESERRKVFFSGDTGPSDIFERIGKRYGPFDLVMLEIGAFHPSWGTIHLGPEKALEVFEMLGGGTLFPVHWGTFNLALHAWDEPAETLITLGRGRPGRIITPRLGAAVEPDHLDGPTPWWRGLGAAQSIEATPRASTFDATIGPRDISTTPD